MKSNSWMPALVVGAVLISAGIAQAQPEGQPCNAEPTDQLIAYGDLLTCAVDVSGDSDLFRFAGEDGDVVLVQVTDHSNPLFFQGVTIQLRNPAGAVLASASSYMAATIQLKLVGSGVFLISVAALGIETIPYTIVLDRIAPPSETAVSINPGDRMLNQGLDPLGDADLFVLHGVTGDLVRLTATDLGNIAFSEGVTVQLFRPDGTLMTSATNHVSAVIEATLDRSGEFAVRVTELDNDHRTSYNLEYQCLIGSCPSYHRLTVGRVGSGAVTSSPIGINCGTDCSERYLAGTVVTLTPTPAAGWAFSTWGGNPDCADGVVTMTAGISCVATFVPLPAGPLVTLDKTSLRFGAVTNGIAFLSQTAPQIVRLTQTGAGTVTWTATPNQPWLQVSPASGSGSADLSVSVVAVGGLPVGSTVTGAITLTLTGASNTAGPITVSLNLIPNGTSAGPFGFVDTPLDNATGVTGAVPFTGWALDDIEVTRVSICRDAFGAEVAPVDGNCRRTRQIFVGFAVFIDGSRPDVAAVYPSSPLHTRAGWGFMVLTNMLPNQGNGTYQFYMYAHDRDALPTLLGTRTMSCANASATKPFGTIDTPDQGGLASGSSFVNFGWALTPQPKMIPLDGSTISVLVDGASLGTVDYNHERADIEALFPGFQNTAGTNGAVGFRVIDTTTLTNGLHTISWVVIDNQGVADGVGSRFFTVSNGVGAPVTAAPAAEALTAKRGRSVPRRSRPLGPSAHVETLPLDRRALPGRRGWDLRAPLRRFTSGASGRTVIRSEEVSRIELQLGPGRYEGYLRTSEGLLALPIGSRLDADTGEFTWAPGVGFVGAYDLTFVRHVGDTAVSRQEVRILLQPKGSGLIGPQVVIDIPTSQQDVGQPFVLAGWGADLRAPEGTGIATLHAWAYPLAGGSPVFLGVTAYGGARPDVAAVHGDQFQESGFGLAVQGLAPGHYDLAVFAWSTEANDFVPARLVRVSVRP